MERTDKQIAAFTGILAIGGLVSVLFLAGFDQQACDQAKQVLFKNDLKHAFGGLGDLAEKLRADRQTLLSGGYTSALVAELYERRNERRRRERKQTQEQLERERDQACSWRWR